MSRYPEGERAIPGSGYRGKTLRVARYPDLGRTIEPWRERVGRAWVVRPDVEGIAWVGCR